MDKIKNYNQLKKFALDSGVDLFGVADISLIKGDFLIVKELSEKFDRAVSIAVRLSGSILEELSCEPTRLYFHHYRTVNMFLDQTALKLSNFIQNRGFSAMPIGASQIVDWQSQKAHLAHKKIGHLAGLGWIGRNNLLVNRRFASQLRLVSVLTDMPLKTDSPVADNCKECRLCIEACPAQAIREQASDFDHIRCFEKLKEFQKKRLVDQYICGVCVKACRPKMRIRGGKS